MSVGLIERLAADPLNLAWIEGEIRRWIVTGGSAEECSIPMQHDQQERGCAAGVARLPGRAESRGVWQDRGYGHKHFEGRGPPAKCQSDRIERTPRRKRHRTQHDAFEETPTGGCLRAMCVILGHQSHAPQRSQVRSAWPNQAETVLRHHMLPFPRS